MSSARYSKPIEPRENFRNGQPRARYEDGNATSKGDKLNMTENLYRMWRDFPELRFAEFLEGAAFMYLDREKGLADATDDELERACYRYWVHHSGRRITPQLRERWS